MSSSSSTSGPSKIPEPDFSKSAAFCIPTPFILLPTPSYSQLLSSLPCPLPPICPTTPEDDAASNLFAKYVKKMKAFRKIRKAVQEYPLRIQEVRDQAKAEFWEAQEEKVQEAAAKKLYYEVSGYIFFPAN